MTESFYTIGAIRAERDRMGRENDPRRFGLLPTYPKRKPCPNELCEHGRVRYFGTTKTCEVCDGTTEVPGLPLNRAEVRHIAAGFPRAFRKRVFGRIHRVHRPQRGTTAHAH